MFKIIFKRIPKNHFVLKRNKYIVLLPEIPDDTPDTNCLLKSDSLPQFSNLDQKTCFNAIGRLLSEYETGIYELNEKLKDPKCQKTVETVIEPLDRLAVPLDFAWATFKIFYCVQHYDKFGESYMRLHQRILLAKQEQYQSSAIYQAFKELEKQKTQLSQPAQRVVKKHLLERELTGLSLTVSKFNNFQTLNGKLNEHKTKYSDNYNATCGKFGKPLTTEQVSDLPKEFLSQIAHDRTKPEKPPWILTLEPKVYQLFMEHCSNRNLRYDMWMAKNTAASPYSGRKHNNSSVIEEIRSCRHQQANLLGYKSFAELSMQTKMAGSIDNVMAMITTINVKTRDTLLQHLYELQSFANDYGFEHKLEQWDLSYWRKLHKKHLYSNAQTEAKNYFPLQNALKGIFRLSNKLFGIEIKEKKADAWNDDVKLYEIRNEGGDFMADFYVDLFERPDTKISGIWMENGRNRSDVVRVTPLSYLIANFKKPGTGEQCLLTFEELRQLLEKFGHVLQHSLTSVPYNDVAGLTNLEWDVVDVCPMFMSAWLRHYDSVKHMSSHVDSGLPLPETLHGNIVKEENHMKSFKLSQQAYLAALDLELYHKRDFWQDVMKKVWAEFLPYFPMDKSEAHPCSFHGIFCGNYPAAYFSTLWAEMIAADVFGAFEESGLDNDEAMANIGKRFRDTYLSLGGSCPPGEVFRRFRGRDPSVDALLAKYGINQKLGPPDQ